MVGQLNTDRKTIGRWSCLLLSLFQEVMLVYNDLTNGLSRWLLICIISLQLHPCLNRAHVLFHFCFKCVHPENQKPQYNLLSLSQMFGYALRSGKHAGLWSHKAYLSWVWMGSCMGAKQLIPVINQQNKTRQDEIRINLILYVNISMASLALTFTFQMARIWTSIYQYR